MTFRTRMLVTFLGAFLAPMIALALFIRAEMTGRLTGQYERRVESLIAVIEEDLAHESEMFATALAILRKAAADDNRFRRAAVDREPEERRYLLDYAGSAMRLTGLSMLQIQDESGRIISSGHFRNEYDRLEPQLPRLLASTPQGTALVRARAPDTPYLALVRVDSLQMGKRRFSIVAGVKVERHFLERLVRDANLTVALVYPGGILDSDSGASRSDDAEPSATVVADETGSGNAIVRELSVPFVDSERGEVALARFRVVHRLTELQQLRGSIDRWFLATVAATVVLAVLLVGWLSSRISRPLVELADKTSRIDLDRLDVDFASRREDEVGALSRILGAMTDRLRKSAVLIKDAERRATLGELARQVNHDIKNGLTPIRNVFRHLTQLGRSHPEQLPGVLEERQSTLDSSISYLENLATHYARLSPQGERRPCDVNEIIHRVAADRRGLDRVQLDLHLGERVVVRGDPLALRRVLENLVDNAIDSLESRAGKVSITAEPVRGDGAAPGVRITVNDTGAGMSEEQMARVFDDFYTTKEGGTGLGLSIVRRLVMDLDGTIDVQSEEGRGSTFLVDLPGTDPV